MRDEHYSFISDIATACMLHLSNVLKVNNKSVYVKFNTNTLNQVAAKYQLKRTNLQRRKGDAPVNSERMQGVGNYVSRMGREHPEWLGEFEACFLRGFEQPEHLQSCLNLLEGTICHVVPICNNEFLDKLLCYLKELLLGKFSQH